MCLLFCVQSNVVCEDPVAVYSVLFVYDGVLLAVCVVWTVCGPVCPGCY